MLLGLKPLSEAKNRPQALEPARWALLSQPDGFSLGPSRLINSLSIEMLVITNVSVINDGSVL